MNKIGFSNERYVKEQSKFISKRLAKFNKLYLEFGGKLFDDYHASRVLPGFEPDAKIRMLLKIKDKVEVVLVINANDVESSKTRSDIEITYTQDLLNKISEFEDVGLNVGGVVITHFDKQLNAKHIRKKLEKKGIKVAYHYIIENYPNDVDKVLSNDGFGKNEYIPTTKDVVVITAPGPGSGKLAVCLSQIYHDSLNGIKSGYAKFETFPVWNLPLNHPVNLAYESATVDLDDVNMIDPFHLENYNQATVNYNRDIEAFPILNDLLTRINGKQIYKSPTDMGVNQIASGIIDDEIIKEASKQEILRRYYDSLVKAYKEEKYADEVVKQEIIMTKANIKKEDRKVAVVANELSRKTGVPCCAIELNDGTIITGKTTEVTGCCSSALLNAVKHLAGLPDEDLISKELLEPIQHLKIEHLRSKNPRLHTDEILVALAIGSKTDERCKKALDALDGLKNTEVHTSVILSRTDKNILKKLGVHLTMEPKTQIN